MYLLIYIEIKSQQSTFDDGLLLITKMEEIVEKLTAKQEEAMKA